MPHYIDLDGIRTWYDVHGDGDSLVLLHPGGVGVDSRVFAPNVHGLAKHFRVYTPDRRWHCRTPDAEGPITFEAMAADAILFIEQVVGGPARLMGMSDGAITVLHVAPRRPDLVLQIASVGGVFHRHAWHPAALESDPDNPGDTEQGLRCGRLSQKWSTSPSSYYC